MMKIVEKLIKNGAVFIENHHKLFYAAMVLVYFAKSVSAGLLGGGRWDLCQHIAMADRFLAGRGLYYSPIEASSPYFPGLAFLSILIGKLFYPWRDYILLVIASLVGTAFFAVLAKFGERFSKNRCLAWVITFLLLSTGFPSYRGYMVEFKADSLVLLCSVFLVLLIDDVEQKKKKAGAVAAVLLLLIGFLMDITKQQALYVDVALGLYLLFTKRLVVKEKIILLGSLIIAGILGIMVIFSVSGVEIQAIKSLKDMPYWAVKSIILQMYSTFRENIFYFLLLILSVYLFFAKKIRLGSLENKWLMIAVCFGAGQIVGGWKSGGNAGNYEAGMVSFLPFVVMAAACFFEEYFVDRKKETVIAFLNYAVCGVLLLLFTLSARHLQKFANKIDTDRSVSAYLSENFADEAVMYYSNQYMQIARSTAVPGMDIYSVPSNIKEYRHTREEYLKNQIYKYIYVNPDDFKAWDDNAEVYFNEKADSYGMLEKYYTALDDPDMPEDLKGQLFVAK